AAALQRTAVVFEVYGDGKLLARSAPRRFGAVAQPLEADVRDVKLIELVARVPGEPTLAGSLPLVWGEAALID
ncbi:MAG TPA: NPCBM/NEW2 domain-containing protein, partial [Croceibacterium sp.]|nr:NPCBM/NEW2 domain-containing protein [Croceibacterium sp.]